MREVVSPLSGIRSPFGQLSSPLAIYAVLGIKPELVFDFANGKFFTMSSRTTFANALTHSRTTNATMVDSDGLLKWGPHNLLLRSEEFDNASWIKSNTTVTANAAVAPDGTTTADRVVGTGTWLIYQVPGNLSGHTIAAWVKSNTGSNQTFRFITNSSQTSANLTATNEWQLFEFKQTAAGSSSGWGLTRDLANGNADLLVWGAHLYRSDLGGMVNNPDRGDSYVPTTSSARYLPRRGHHVYNSSAWVNEGVLHESEARTNLEDYSNFASGWAAVSVTLDLNAAVSPEGSSNAASLVSISGTSYGINSTGITVSAAAHTASAYFKANGFNYAKLTWLSVANGVDYAVFNLSNGTVSGGAYTSATIEDVGNGWYRCSITSTLNATAGAGFYAWISNGTLSRGSGVTGDGTSGIYVYGAQLEAGSTPSSYIPTAGAAVTRAAETLTIPAANLPWPTPNVIGAELVTNGTFDTDVSGWSAASDGRNSVTWSSGKLRITNITASQGYAYQTISTVVGRLYKFEWTPSNVSTLYATRVYWGNAEGTTSGGGASPAAVLSGPQSITFVATTTTTYIAVQLFTATAGAAYDFDNISVREIDPLAVSIQMQGKMTYADTGTNAEVTFSRWYLDANNRIQHFVDTASTETGRVRFDQSALGTNDAVESVEDAYSPGVNVPFNIASRHGSTFINGAVDGTALTVNPTPTALPDLSATNLQLGFDYMGTIKLLRIWAADLADAGIATASAPSLEPSLFLTFDGSEGSFTVDDWSE